MRILVTGGRTPLALDLARHFYNAGHEIYVAETSKLHICRFSNTVADSFVVPSPRFDPDEFINRLVKIVSDEKIDFLIPTCEEIFYISRDLHRFSKNCMIFSSPFEVLDSLHNKWLFHTKLKSMGLPTPAAVLIQNREDLNQLDLSTPYALKACYSRASQKMVKLQGEGAFFELNIHPADPWMAQSWVKGKKYCTYSLCQKGQLVAHTTYPVRFTVDQHSCLFFKAIDHSPIFRWVESFVREEKFTGQIAFDFIEDEEKKLFAIECNPRSTSGLHLFRASDRIDQAFFNQSNSTIFPKKGSRKQIAIGMLLYGWKTAFAEKTFGSYLKSLFSSQDVIFSFKDLKPFFMQVFVCFSYILTSLKLKLSLPAMFMHDLEFNGENRNEISDLTQAFEPERIDSE